MAAGCLLILTKAASPKLNRTVGSAFLVSAGQPQVCLEGFSGGIKG